MSDLYSTHDEGIIEWQCVFSLNISAFVLQDDSDEEGGGCTAGCCGEIGFGCGGGDYDSDEEDSEDYDDEEEEDEEEEEEDEGEEEGEAAANPKDNHPAAATTAAPAQSGSDEGPAAKRQKTE